MSTITGTAIINAAAFTLQDATNTQWDRAELFGYVNDGQRDICLAKPDACTVNASVALIAGTKQAIPAGANAFVKIARNMGTNGTTPGRVPREIPLAVLDMQNPNWHTATASAIVMEYGYDERDPKTYYVSPPQPASGMGQVELVYFGVPADLSAEANTIGLDDIYKTALVNYLIYRAYLKEGEFNNPAGATAHRAEFLALLGAKDKAEEDDGKAGK